MPINQLKLGADFFKLNTLLFRNACAAESH